MDEAFSVMDTSAKEVRFQPPAPARELDKLLHYAEKVVRREEDADMQATVKAFTLLVSVCLCVSQLCALPFTLGHISIVQVTGSATIMITSICSVLVLVKTKSFPGFCVIASVLLYSLGFILLDLAALGAQSPRRKWPYFLILTDFLVINQVDQKVLVAFIVLVLAHILIIYTDVVTDFGYLQIFRDLTDHCPTPPCSDASDAIDGSSTEILLFLFDFIVTRGLTSAHMQENQRQEETIILVGEITESLAVFSVDDLEDKLYRYTAASALQAALRDSLMALVRNLKSYRPFLPDALFQELHSPLTRRKSRHLSIAPPGMNSGTTSTLAFTDIKGSTTLWENDPENMQRALKIHNSIIRDEMDKFGGYEVKTIGDAFMVAFELPEDAVYFALCVQEHLMNAAWPHNFQHPYPNTVAFREQNGQPDYWRGLVVRIGINTGDAAMEVNGLTGRCDYLGQCVNIAARIESVGVGGAVAVSEETLLAIEACGDRNPVTLMDGVVIPMGVVPLKGVTDTTSLHLILPGSLREREQGVRRELRERNKEERERKERVFPTGVGSRSTSFASPTTQDLCGEETVTPKMDTLGVDNHHLGDISSEEVLSVMSTPTQLPLEKDAVTADTESTTTRSTHFSQGSSRASVDPSSRGQPTHSQMGSFRFGLAIPGTIPTLPSFGGNSNAAGMEKSVLATVGCVDITVDRGPATGSSFNPAFCVACSAILTCLQRTEGSSISLFSHKLLVGWNTTVPCKSHIVSSLRFLHLVSKNTAKTNARPATQCSFGTCSGSVVVGHIGSLSHRLMACVGVPVQLALSLCTSSVSLGIPCLYSLTNKIPEGHIASVMRPLERMIGVADSDVAGLLVMEVSPARVGVSSVMQMLDSGSEEEEDWGWGNGYKTAFEESNEEEIREHAADDRVLLMVADSMLTGIPLF